MSMDEKAFRDYISVLANKKIYKILPLYEEKNKGVSKYVDSLLLELKGLGKVFEMLDANADYITLLATFEALSDECFNFDASNEVVKREVFKCITVTKRILETTTKQKGL